MIILKGSQLSRRPEIFCEALLTRVMFPGGSLRWIAATLTCVTAISGFVMMGRIEQGVPSGLCRVW
jgi:hypothetical protein